MKNWKLKYDLFSIEINKDGLYIILIKPKSNEKIKFLYHFISIEKNKRKFALIFK